MFKYLFYFFIILHICCSIASIYYYTKKDQTKDDVYKSVNISFWPSSFTAIVCIVWLVRVMFIQSGPSMWNATSIVLFWHVLLIFIVFIYPITKVGSYISPKNESEVVNDPGVFGCMITYHIICIITFVIFSFFNENTIRRDIGLSLLSVVAPAPRPIYTREAISRKLYKQAPLIDVANRGNAFPRDIANIVGDYAEGPQE